MISSASRWLTRLLREEEGQSAVEYVLGISVIAIGISVAFIYMSESTKDIFRNAQQIVELPYP